MLLGTLGTWTENSYITKHCNHIHKNKNIAITLHKIV